MAQVVFYVREGLVEPGKGTTMVFRFLESGLARLVGLLTAGPASFFCYRCNTSRCDFAAGAGTGSMGGVSGVGVVGQGAVGSGMSSMRLVGPTGRDQSYVSTGDPSFRKGPCSRAEDEVAALVVNNVSGMLFGWYCWISAPRAVFTTLPA